MMNVPAINLDVLRSIPLLQKVGLLLMVLGDPRGILLLCGRAEIFGNRGAAGDDRHTR